MKIHGFNVIGTVVTHEGPFEIIKYYVRGHVTHLRASFTYGYTGQESVFTTKVLKPTHTFEVK